MKKRKKKERKTEEKEKEKRKQKNKNKKTTTTEPCTYCSKYGDKMVKRYKFKVVVAEGCCSFIRSSIASHVPHVN